MNKEEIENLVNTDFEKMQIIVNRIFKEEYVRKLEQENKELHNKIDKAIEYIKNKQVIDLDYLEKILKGDVDE